jgi:hypothetical protein
VASILKSEYENLYRCISYTNNTWQQYVNGFWIHLEDPYSLFNFDFESFCSFWSFDFFESVNNFTDFAKKIQHSESFRGDGLD